MRMKEDDNKLVGVERLYFYGAEDIDGFQAAKPIMTVKARLTLTRDD